MSILYWEKEQNVARIVMDNGENRHNPEFIDALLTAFDEIEADPSMQGIVLTSSDPKYWSLGIDLNWMMAAIGDAARHDEVRGFMNGLNKMFVRIMTLPMPVVAVINGHAFGDGSIMSCACDFRFMRADRGFFCFPEVDINIPFMPGMQAVVRRALPEYKFAEMALMGKRVGGAEAEADHIVVKAFPDEASLLSESLTFAQSFAKNRPIFAEMKRRMNKHVIEIIEKEDPPLIESLTLLA